MCQHQNEIYLCHCLSQDRLVYETGIESLRIMLLFDGSLRITNDNPIVQSYIINPKVKVKYAPQPDTIAFCMSVLSSVVHLPGPYSGIVALTYCMKLFELNWIEFQGLSAAISHYRNWLNSFGSQRVSGIFCILKQRHQKVKKANSMHHWVNWRWLYFNIFILSNKKCKKLVWENEE